jgi:hypothetical protein
MLSKRLLVLSTIVLLLVATLIILPTMTTSSSFCSNSIAAQGDEACLAEKATISALQVELQQVSFQATLDTINHQATLAAMSSAAGVDCPATISALQAEGANPPEGAAPPSISSVFTDDFSGNSHGWDLTNGVTISRGALALYGGGDAVVPFEASDSFYLEVDATTTNCVWGWGPFFIGFGDISGGRWHQVVFGCSEMRLNSIIGDSTETIFSADQRVKRNTVYRIGIVYQGGQLEIHVDETLISIVQVTALGNELMLGKQASHPSAEVYFDNLVIQALQ